MVNPIEVKRKLCEKLGKTVREGICNQKTSHSQPPTQDNGCKHGFSTRIYVITALHMCVARRVFSARLMIGYEIFPLRARAKNLFYLKKLVKPVKLATFTAERFSGVDPLALPLSFSLSLSLS